MTNSWRAVALLSLIMGVAVCASAQDAPPAQPPPASAQTPPPTGDQNRRVGGFVPGQKRPPGDPAQIARGKTLFEINCRACHGADLRGGDLGGPNLLRSQVALSDLNGELIVPIIHGSRQNMGMPAIGLKDPDAMAVAAYVRSVIEMIGQQGTPPSLGKEPPSILIGNASEGKAFFASKCSSCHSPSGDLQGLAKKIPDARKLQTAWVAGGRNEDSVGGESSARTPTVSITLPSGESIEGKLLRIDDFLVSVTLADGTSRTFPRDGDEPKVVVHDPMKIHRDLWAQYTDKDIHDVTAYLVTLK